MYVKTQRWRMACSDWVRGERSLVGGWIGRELRSWKSRRRRSSAGRPFRVYVMTQIIRLSILPRLNYAELSKSWGAGFRTTISTRERKKAPAAMVGVSTRFAIFAYIDPSYIGRELRAPRLHHRLDIRRLSSCLSSSRRSQLPQLCRVVLRQPFR